MDNIVEIRDLVKTLGTYRLEADLDIPRGYVVGLIGENGAGKTTLIKCMTGVNRIDSGEVRLLGRPLEGRVPGDVGIVFDDCHFHTGMDGRQLNRLMGHLFPQWEQQVHGADDQLRHTHGQEGQGILPRNEDEGPGRRRPLP